MDDLQKEKQRLYRSNVIWNDNKECVFKYGDIYFEQLKYLNYPPNDLYLTCLIIAHKFLDDDHFYNSDYISFFRRDMKLSYINELEMICLKSLNFELFKNNI